MCQLDRDPNTGDMRVIGGEWLKIRDKNRAAIKTEMLKRLDELWSNQVAIFFELSPQDVTESVGSEFENTFSSMRTQYFDEGHGKYGKCAEVIESYNEWYKAKGVDGLLTTFVQLSEQARERLQAEQRVNIERAERIEMAQIQAEAELNYKTSIVAIQSSLDQINQRNAALQNQMDQITKQHADELTEYRQEIRELRAKADRDRENSCTLL